ncbi:hypothetical protein Hanom_Chr15g01343991 [Helianthus anomalus]
MLARIYTGDAKIPDGCRPISNGSKFPVMLYVAYPFGIRVGSGCSIDESFDLTCNTTYDPPKLFTLVQSFDLRLFCLDCFLM